MNSWAMPGMMRPITFGGNIFDILFGISILVLPLLLIFTIFDRLFSPNEYFLNNQSPNEILKKRFAKGEISKQELDERLQELQRLDRKEENMT